MFLFEIYSLQLQDFYSLFNLRKTSMQIVIEESAINNFNLIAQLALTNTICSHNFVNIHASVSQIISRFESLASQRPKLKKLGIYCRIFLSHISLPFNYTSCKQILTQYIYSIGWNDLQYISFCRFTVDGVELHLILNRVTPTLQLIDLNCLGANTRQYDIFRKSCSLFLQPDFTNFPLKLWQFS